MQLYILNEKFETTGVIKLDHNNYLSIIRKYYDLSEINFKCNKFFINQLKDCRYLYFNKQTFKITTLEALSDEITLKGYSLEIIFRDRTVLGNHNFYDYPSKILEDLVRLACIDVAPNRKIDIEIKPSNIQTKKIQKQISNQNLLSALQELSLEQELSFDINYDYIQHKLSFHVWQGTDRTQSQNLNSWAVFSENFKNIKETNFLSTDLDYKNYVYVFGEGLNEERILVEVDKTSGDLERKELVVDARDLRMEEDMTLEQYQNLLYQRGLEKLSEFQRSVEANAQILERNLILGKDVFFGDKVTFKLDDFNINIDRRIVEVIKVYDKLEETDEIKFGNDNLTFSKKLLKGVI